MRIFTVPSRASYLGDVHRTPGRPGLARQMVGSNRSAIVSAGRPMSSEANMKFGTSVLVLPYLHPMGLAKALATIDQLSHGRLIAGTGSRIPW
jgi:hypothetical protein